MKRRFFAIIIAIVAVLLAVGIFTAVAGAQTAEPTVKTHAYNLVFDNQVYIEYAVRISGAENISLSDVGLLIWREGATKHTPESAVADIKAFKTANIDGVLCYVAKYTDLTAKEMADIVTARPYVTLGGTTYYGDDVDYSICEYAERKLGFVYGVAGTENADLSAMLYSMIDYGANAQKYFGYRTDRLATYILPKNRLNVIFDADGAGDIPAQTVAKGNKAISPVAPTKEGFEFLGWFNGDAAWDFGTDTVTENVTLTAKWKKTITYSEGLVYRQGSNSYQVSGIGSCTDSDIYIPPTYNGLPVTRIRLGAFSGTSVKSISIPSTVTLIDTPFASVTVEKITVDPANSVYYSINNCVIKKSDGTLIAGCHTSVIPNDGSVLHIGEYSFAGTNIALIEIPDSVTTIGRNAFNDCSGIGETVDGVTYLGKWAIGYTSDIPASVTLRSGTIGIAGFAFNSAKKITSVIIPSSVLYICDRAFYQTSITEATFKVTEGWNWWAWEYQVYDQTPILSSIMSDKSTAAKIINGGYSFGNYSAYDIIRLPSLSYSNNSDGTCTVAGIGTVTSQDIVIPEVSSDGYKVTAIGVNAFKKNHNITSVVIPNSVTSIGISAFHNCSNLVSVTLPDNITVISNSTFKNCSKLSSIVIPNSVTTIGIEAFRNCYELKSVIFGDSVSSIEKNAFKECYALESINLPDSVVNIGSGTFDYCNGLEKITVAQGNSKYHSNGNCLIETAGKTLILSCKNSIIPADGSVTSIRYSAFYGFTELTKIAIPVNVTNIGDHAFYCCENLTEIHYSGTMEEWNAISKGSEWDYNTGNYTIFCSDGSISK